MVVSARTTYRATLCWIGRCRNGVALQAEYGYIARVRRHCEAVARICGHLCAVLRPFDKVVARVGRSRQSASAATLVRSCTAHRTACRRTSRGRNGVAAILAKVRHVSAATRYRETIIGIGRDHRAILCPIRKGVACAGCGRQGAGAAVVVGACPAHAASRRWAGRCRNSVALQAENRHIARVRRHREAVARTCGNLCAVLRPFDKVVARVGCGPQRASAATLVSSCTAHRTACRRTGRGRDGVICRREVEHIRGNRRTQTIGAKRNSSGRLEVELSALVVVVQLEGYLVAAVSEYSQKKHIASRHIKQRRPCRSTALGATKGTYLQGRALLLHPINLDDTRQRHVVFVGRTHRRPMVGLCQHRHRHEPCYQKDDESFSIIHSSVCFLLLKISVQIKLYCF